MNFEITKELIQGIEEAIEEGRGDYIISELEELHAADINVILYELNSDQAKYVLQLLDLHVGAEILSDLEEDVRAKFLKQFTSEEIAVYIPLIDSDDAADILNEQNIRTRENVIALIEDKTKVANILELLRYDEDSAGGLMAKEFIVAKSNWTVIQCIEEIRRKREDVDSIYSIYVVDEAEKLIGRVSLKKLILAPDEAQIIQVYDDSIYSVDAFASEVEVAHLMMKYDLVAVPVVNVQQKLIGRITVDDVMDVISEQNELNQQAMAGISENVEESDSVWTLSRARLPWLIIGMTGGLLGAEFIGLFKGVLDEVQAMAFFIPLITATGGNVGIQSSTLIVQSLANTDGLTDSIFSRLMKSLIVAVVNGIVISSLVFGFNFYLHDNVILSAVVAISLFCVVMLASLSGTITPLILNKIGINPALAAGPFITTSNDLLGIAVYFSMAYLLLL